MDGIIFGKLKIKHIIIIFRIISIILFFVYLIKRLLLNYSQIYSFGFSIENALQSTVLSILFLLFFCISFIIPIAKNSKNSIIFLVIAIICSILLSVVTMKIPQVTIFESNKTDSEVSPYFSFDEHIDNNSSQNYYYLKTVKLFDTYWIGCNLNKKYESANSFEDLTDDVSDNSILISYYYMKNPSKHRIQEYSKKSVLSDINMVYDNEIHTDDYSVYEYGNTYEFVSVQDDEIFHLTSDKNKRIHYDLDEFVIYSKNLMSVLRNSD